MLGLIAQYRLLLITAGVAALMALSAAAAWQWQANTYGRQLAAAQLAHTADLALIANAASAQLRTQQAARLTLERRLSLLDAQHYQELAHAQQNTDLLTADLTAARRRLSVRIRPASAGDVPDSAGAARVDDGAGTRAELYGSTAAGIVRVAGEADQCAVKLTALQEWARAVAE